MLKQNPFFDKIFLKKYAKNPCTSDCWTHSTKLYLHITWDPALFATCMRTVQLRAYISILVSSYIVFHANLPFAQNTL